MLDLKVEAYRYWQMGFNVVALFFEDKGGKVEKRAFVEWGKWHRERQSEEEFNSQPWERADGFGVVCSFPNKDGLFLAVVDYDVKGVDEGAKAKGKALLSKFPVTQMEQTVSDGTHLVYLSRVKPSRSISEFHGSHGLELIATGKLCVMAPSRGYKRLNDNPPRVVEDVESLFCEVLGVEDRRVEAGKGGEKEVLEKWLSRLKQHLKVKGEGSQYVYCHCPFHPPDNHPSFAINKLKFYAVDYHDCRVYSLKELAEILGVQLEEADVEGEEAKVVRVCFAELSDGRLIEQAFNSEKTFFLIYNPKMDTVEKAESVEDNGVVYKPIESPELANKTVLFPSGVEEYGNEEALTSEVTMFLDKWHEPPDSASRVLDVYYCFLTYIQDLIPQLPYRRVLASWGKGKSAWIDALGSICYRPVLLAGSDTDKSIVRRMHLWRGTYLIDEADFASSNLYAFIIKILNIGFDRRKGWYYRCDEDNPKRVLGYYVYGAKLLATRSRYKDVALESRCLTTIGRENTKPIPLFRMERFEEEAQRLRNKLILWRFRNYYRVKEEAKRLEQPEIAEKLYDGADRVSSRVKQVILPLWLVMGEQMRERLVALAKTFDERLKAEDSEYLLELETREAVTKLVENSSEGVNKVKVLNVLYMREGREEEFYSVQLSVLSREILKLRGMKEEDITVKEVTSVSKTLSKLFESRLGFAIKVGKARRREVLIPVEWVKTEKIVELEDFFEEGGSHNKNVQNLHLVHPTPSVSELL
ncbi:MAG: bifunctional DNA primase/polymerase, partial [Candidatus Bathyarchaeia archaeon]